MKIFGVVFALVLLFAMFAFACDGPNCAPYTVGPYGSYNAGGGQNFTGGNQVIGNEFASVGGGATVDAGTNNYANGPSQKILWFKIDPTVVGGANANANLEFKLYTKDNGLDSHSAACGEVEAEGSTWGLALSPKGKGAYSLSEVAVSGTVGQKNGAGETGYANGQGISGGNWSQASFSNSDKDLSCGPYLAGSAAGAEGSAKVGGFTNVAINPGVSIKGDTGNFAIGNAGVAGEGQVGGNVNNGNAGAGGYTGFSYIGDSQGSGYATFNAGVTGTGNSFSSHSSGFATTSSK